MKKFINIKDTKNALKDLEEFRSKRYSTIVKLKNVNLKRINEIIEFTLFRKNDLYVDSDTLFDLMQPKGGRGKHNYHNISPKLFLSAINDLAKPICVLDDGHDKYAIVLMTKYENRDPLLSVIETGCRLDNDLDANINKLVTMYPKEKINNYLSRVKPNKIIYLNKIELNKIK